MWDIVVKQHFPKHQNLNKTFNKNSLMLSYCCIKNMSSIIKQYIVIYFLQNPPKSAAVMAEIKTLSPSKGIF